MIYYIIIEFRNSVFLLELKIIIMLDVIYLAS